MVEEEARRRDTRGGTGHAAACQTDVDVRDEQLRCVVMLRPAGALERGNLGGQEGYGQGARGSAMGLEGGGASVG